MAGLGRLGDGAVALVGAGASVDAGLPVALELIDSIIDAVVPTSWAAAELRAAARDGRGGQRTANEFLRLELLLDWVGRLFDDQLRVLDFIGQVTVPGRLHRTLAQGVVGHGLRLITTNFDDLLEQALVPIAPSPVRTVIAGRSASLAPTDVVKLHGSLHVHKGGRRRPSPEPIHATISLIARRNPGLDLGGTAFDQLDALSRGRDLVVVGYSASDDFDIVPALRRIRPRRVIWVDHADHLPRMVARRHLPRGTRWVELLDHVADHTEVEVWQGRSVEALHVIGLPVAPPEVPVDPGTPPDWRKHVEAWGTSVRHHDPTGLGLAGRLFGDLDDRKLETYALHASRPCEDPEIGWTRSERATSIVQMTFVNGPAEDRAALERLAGRALAIAVAEGHPADVRQARFIAARITFWFGDHDAARIEFEQIKASCRRGTPDWASAQAWIGRCDAFSAPTRSAVRTLASAVRQLRRLGELNELITALNGLAVLLIGLGEPDQALDVLLEMEQVARLLGQGDRLCEAAILRSGAELRLGRTEDALADARAGVRLAVEFDHPEAAVAHAQLALVQTHVGRHAAAVRSCHRAIALAWEPMVAAEYRSLLAENQLLCEHHRAARATAEAVLADASALGDSRVRAAAVVGALDAKRLVDLREELGALGAGVPRTVRVTIAMVLVRLEIPVWGVTATLRRGEAAASSLGDAAAASAIGRYRTCGPARRSGLP